MLLTSILITTCFKTWKYQAFIPVNCLFWKYSEAFVRNCWFQLFFQFHRKQGVNATNMQGITEGEWNWENMEDRERRLNEQHSVREKITRVIACKYLKIGVDTKARRRKGVPQMRNSQSNELVLDSCLRRVVSTVETLETSTNLILHINSWSRISKKI